MARTDKVERGYSHKAAKVEHHRRDRRTMRHVMADEEFDGSVYDVSREGMRLRRRNLVDDYYG